MTSPILDVLSRTLAAVAPDSGPAVLETAARGTVTTRARFRRREIVQDLRTGEAGLLTAEVLASVPVADARGVEIGDVVWTRDKLWKVSSPLDDGGENIVLQLIEAQKTTALLDDDTVEVVVVGDPDGTAPVVALAPSGVLRRSDVVSLDGDTYRVGTPTDWPAGGLRRYLLTPVEA